MTHIYLLADLGSGYMNVNLSIQLEQLSIKLRTALGLITEKEKYSDFEQVSYEELSKYITEAFSYISIKDEIVDDTYVIKCSNTGDDTAVKDHFEIYIDKSKKDIELLIHEVAHVLFHRHNMPYNVPIGKNVGTWEQELEANYFARAFLIPKDYFIKALSVFSRNDGTVDLENFSKRFKVQQKLIVERGIDLKIW